MHMLVVVAALLLGACTASDASSFGCRDDDGNAVDFWLAIKMPDGFHFCEWVLALIMCSVSALDTIQDNIDEERTCHG